MKNPVKLKKGKLIDTIDGVVETWDWVVNFCKNLAGDGSGAKVKNNLTDFPKIAIDKSKADDNDDDEPIEPETDDDELPEIPLDPMGLSDLGGGGTSIRHERLVLESGDNSNLKFTSYTTKDADGTLVRHVKIDVLWKQ